MPDFTADELKSAMVNWLEDEGNDYDYFANYGYNTGYTFDLPGFGAVETVDSQGEYQEVSGEYAGAYSTWNVWLVVKVQGRYFKFHGR